MVITRSSCQWAQEAHINWELNERISLSSAGSASRNSSNSNTLKKNTSKVRSSLNEKSTQSKKKDKCKQVLSDVPPDPETPVQRRWNVANNRLDRTNDALAKRLNVIQELNKKIIANYDKIHEPAAVRKNRWKPKDDILSSCSSSTPIDRPSKVRDVDLISKRQKMNFQVCAGGEWILPDEAPSQCTLLRSDKQQIEEEEEEEEEQQQHDDSASVLRELNEAIDRFEEEDDLKKQQQNGCHDSSWDSGVGAEVQQQQQLSTSSNKTGIEDKSTGWLRIHTGLESSLVYLTLETSAADVCRDMLLSDGLALYVQVLLYYCT